MSLTKSKKADKKVVENDRPKGLHAFFQKAPQQNKPETPEAVNSFTVESTVVEHQPSTTQNKLLDLTISPTSVDSSPPVFPLFSGKKTKSASISKNEETRIEIGVETPVAIKLDEPSMCLDKETENCTVDLISEASAVDKLDYDAHAEIEDTTTVVNISSSPVEANPEADDGGRRRSSRIKVLATHQIIAQEQRRKQQEQEEREAEEKREKRRASLAAAKKKRQDDEQSDNDETKQKSTKIKKTVSSVFFVSKEEKARLLAEEKERKAKQLQEEREAFARKQAEERERRIQEQMIQSKLENDRRLALANANGAQTDALNPFFAARTISKTNANSINLIDDARMDTDNSFELLSMINQYSGSDAWMVEMLTYAPDEEEIMLDDREELEEDTKTHIIDLLDDEKKDTESLTNFKSNTNEYFSDENLRSLWVEYILQTTDDSKSTTVDLSEEKSCPAMKEYDMKKDFDEYHNHFYNWLKYWVQKKLAATTTATTTTTTIDNNDDDVLRDSDEEFEYADSDEEYGNKKKNKKEKPFAAVGDISNLYIIEGPLASGKTNLVYLCAKELNVDVIEVNTSQVRSGVNIKRLISEVGQTKTVLSQGGSQVSKDKQDIEIFRLDVDDEQDEIPMSMTTTKQKTVIKKPLLPLILIDEMDIVFPEDSNFHTALWKLATTAHCPVVITAERIPTHFNDAYASFLYLMRPTLRHSLSYIQSTMPNTSIQSLMPLALASHADIRASLRMIEMLKTSKKSSKYLSAIPTKSFGEWLCSKASRGCLFDKIVSSSLQYEESPIAVEGDSSKDTTIVYHPVVHSIYPRCVSISTPNGKIILQGRHFLQGKDLGEKLDDCENNIAAAAVEVKICGISCECIILSDDQIVVNLPSTLPIGVHTVSLSLKFAISKKNERVFESSAYPCGIANSWILVTEQKTNFHRAFAAIKTKTFANMKSIQAQQHFFSGHTGAATTEGMEGTSLKIVKKKKLQTKRGGGKKRPKLINKKRYTADESEEEMVNEGDDIEDIEVEDGNNNSNVQSDDDGIEEFSSDNEEWNTSVLQKRKLRAAILSSDDEKEVVETVKTNIDENTCKRMTKETEESCGDVQKMIDIDDADVDNSILQVEEQLDAKTLELIVAASATPDVYQTNLLQQLNAVDGTRRAKKQGTSEGFTVPPGLEFTSEEAIPYSRVLKTSTQHHKEEELYSWERMTMQLDHLSSSDLFTAYSLSNMDIYAEDEAEEDHPRYRYNRNTCMDRINQLIGSYDHSIAEISEMFAFPKSSAVSTRASPPVMKEAPYKKEVKEKEVIYGKAEYMTNNRQDLPLLEMIQSPYLAYLYQQNIIQQNIITYHYLLTHQPIHSLPSSTVWLQDLLPYISLIGRWSKIAEENEKHSYNVSKSGRRLSSSLNRTSSITSSSSTAQSYQYLRDAFQHITEENEIAEIIAYNQSLQIYPLLM